MTNIIIVATMVAKEDQVDLVKEELGKLLEPTLSEAGNVSYRINQDVKDPTIFIAIEEWTSLEAVQEHMQTEHIKAYSLATKEAIVSFEHNVLNELKTNGSK